MSDYDPNIRPMDPKIWAEFRAAKRPTKCGDFWTWLAEKYPNPARGARTAVAQPSIAQDATTAAAAAERARLEGILNHPEAQGREPVARKIAFETRIDPATAAGILAALPRAAGPGGAPAKSGKAHILAQLAPRGGRKEAGAQEAAGRQRSARRRGKGLRRHSGKILRRSGGSGRIAYPGANGVTHNGIAPREFTAPEPAGGAQAGAATVHAAPAH